jgi:hypothetical protein
MQPRLGVGRTSALEQWITLATATAVMVYGLSRRTRPGAWLAIAAAPGCLSRTDRKVAGRRS